MKARKSLLFVLLALAMLVSACGGGSGGAATTAQAPAATTAAPATTTAAPATTTPAATTAAPADDVPTLIWFMGSPGQIPPDQARVEDKLNEISVKAIGAKVKTIYMTNDEVLLALAAGDEWDKVFTCEWYNNYAVQALAGYFVDITDKLPSVTPALWADMPEVVWDGARINGKIMAVPVKKDYAAEMFWRFDRDLYESLGMPIPENMSFFDVEPYLEAAKKAWDDKNPLAKVEYPMTIAKGGVGGLISDFDMINRDILIGIPYSAIGTADENKVMLVVNHPEAIERINAAHKWYKAGYINPDAMTTENSDPKFAVRSGQGFYGADAIWTGGSGFPNAISKYSGPFLSTASIRGSMNAINARSQHVDLTLKLIELIYTNQEYRDILRYGIEGEHWNKTPEGLAKRTQAGVDGYTIWQFAQGSYSLSRVEAAEGVTVDPNMWNVIFKSYEKAVATKSIGFSFDPKDVEVEIAAVSAAKAKYWDGLTTGTLDPATNLPLMVSEFEANGINRVIEECQKQLDAFLAIN
jgi:putative aldouronate transport system substrate-binding protein